MRSAVRLAVVRVESAHTVLTQKRSIGLLLLFATSIFGACNLSTHGWRARHGADHPLVGRIFDVKDRRFIDSEELSSALAGAEFVLLGERHDHPDHHRLQAEVVDWLLARGRHPAIAFEVFNVEDGAAIERHLRDHPGDVDGIAEVVRWRESGWPAWKFYRPIVARAVAAELPVLATNLSRSEVRELADTALAAGLENSAPASEATLASLRETEPGRRILELGLDRPIDPAVEATMAESIRRSHCGHAPGDMIPKMILSQRARDAQMSETLVARGESEGVVLIAGSGHARTDRGAPKYLRDRLPDARVASLGFLEVIEAADTPAAHTRAMGQTILPFDYVWFTPRIDDEDPCEAFRKSLEKMRGSEPES